MADQNFRSPNFYEREIDLSGLTVGGPSGTPAAAIGTANKGPAFVPVTVANFSAFQDVFGGLDPDRHGPYAANEWLKHRNALTYLRVLGAGANTTSTHIDSTSVTGRVRNAGFKITGSYAAYGGTRHDGVVQFLAARHTIQTDEAAGMPIFTDNSSRSGASVMNLVRGVVFMPSGSRMMVFNGDEAISSALFTPAGPDDVATVVANRVKIAISSSQGPTWSYDDKCPGVKIFTASFNPTDSDYFGKVLNTNPSRFFTDQHYLYLDFAVDDELATAATVAVLSGSTNTSTTSGETSTMFLNAFGAFDTRFMAPKTPYIISQPFGVVEYDLFYLEAIDDGEYANTLYKVSITNLKKSENDAYRYGTFTVNIRDWNDTDTNMNVIESYPNCTLDPTSENYVAKRIGDRKVYFNFDAVQDSERRLVASGKYPNMSKYVRVVMNESVDRGLVPPTSLPFGFRGFPSLKTNDSLTDLAGTSPRLAGVLGVTSAGSALSGSIVPPLPFRYKVTKGTAPVYASQTYAGSPSQSEIVTSNYHWGVKFERNTAPLNPNPVTEKNVLLSSLTKLQGIAKLDTLLSGTGKDTQNNDKFTLARVALPNTSISHLTASVTDHMLGAAYLRNSKQDPSTYTVIDPVDSSARVTFGSLAAQTGSIDFNRFQTFMKFTTFLAGGFDGLNVFDESNWLMNDRSVSFDTGGGAIATYIPSGSTINQNGTLTSNANVVAYRAATDIMLDPMNVVHNVFAIPGITESYITDYAADKAKTFGLSLYVMDIPGYDDDQNRLYDDQTTRPDVDKTATVLAGRAYDNSYVSTYWPPVFIDDESNKRRVKVPASVAAIGALAFNDKVSYPWFAPAGFNRGALDFVKNVTVRLNVSDRDTLQDWKINPIATFPQTGYVIFGQKTLQMAKSALDRVNVRRMLLEVKRIIIEIAKKMCFEQNTPEVRAKFVADSSLQLALIQTNAGIEEFRVIMNETNNTQDDVDQNKVNGKIVVVPTRTIEYISIDFVITRQGVAFI